jgi:hypothetical protein
MHPITPIINKKFQPQPKINKRGQTVSSYYTNAEDGMQVLHIFWQNKSAFILWEWVFKI